jgi:hypothetical protein
MVAINPDSLIILSDRLPLADAKVVTGTEVLKFKHLFLCYPRGNEVKRNKYPEGIGVEAMAASTAFQNLNSRPT